MKKQRYPLFYINYFGNTGQSLIEILVALGVGAILIIAGTGVIIPSLRANTQADKVQVSSAFGKELLENVRVFSEGDWHNIYNLNKTSSNHYYLTTSTSPFLVISGDENIRLATTTYTRYFYVDNVGRDAGGSIQSSGGTDDPSTQKLTVVYGWSGGPTSSFSTYLTRFRNNVFNQTDWSGGSGQDGPITNANSKFSASVQINYSTTTGSIMIQFQ